MMHYTVGNKFIRISSKHSTGTLVSDAIARISVIKIMLLIEARAKVTTEST